MLEPNQDIHQIHPYDDQIHPYQHYQHSSQISIIIYQLQDQIRILNLQMGQMNTQVSHLERIVREQNIIIYNESCRSYNASAIAGSHLIRPLKNNQGLLPHEIQPQIYFPSSRVEFYNLTSVQCDKILKFYDLPVIDGRSITPVHAKYRSIASFVGLRE